MDASILSRQLTPRSPHVAPRLAASLSGAAGLDTFHTTIPP